jgi:AcrR family transcriptional regulator
MGYMAECETAPPLDGTVGVATAHYLRGDAIEMSSLAAELGVSRATLYRRVGNHEELLGRVLERQTELTFEHTTGDHGLTGIDAVVDRLQKFTVAVVGSGPLRALIERDPLLFVRVVMGPGRVEMTATRLVEQLITSELPQRLVVDSAVLARALVRVCDSFMYSHLLSDTEPELPAAITVVRLLMDSAVRSDRAALHQPSQTSAAVADDLSSGQEAPREMPATERGLRTRAELLAAARRVFERLGYNDARLVDITNEAGCSIGTLYTYFDGKKAIFSVVLEASRQDMLHPGTAHVIDAHDPYGVIEASNRAYFEAYRRNAQLMVVFEQVAHLDDEIRELRRRRNAGFVERNARSIADLQARGLADPGLDALTASRALSGMVSRLAYSNFGFDEGEDGNGTLSVDALVLTATRLWANALGLTNGSDARSADARRTDGHRTEARKAAPPGPNAHLT